MARRFDRTAPCEEGVAVCGGAIGEPERRRWQELVEQQWGVTECGVGVAVVCGGCALPERIGAVGNGREVGGGGGTGGGGSGDADVFVFAFVFAFVFVLYLFMYFCICFCICICFCFCICLCLFLFGWLCLLVGCGCCLLMCRFVVFSGVPMMVSGKKKMICIDLNSSNDGGGSKIIELRGPRARQMYVGCCDAPCGTSIV